MAQRRYLDPSQPQTLQMATMLLYMYAALAVLRLAFLTPLGLVFVAGEAGGAYFMANEKKWGYAAAVSIAGLRAGLLVLPLISTFRPSYLFSISVGYTVELILAGALLALLLHPQSREYQRIWFS